MKQYLKWAAGLLASFGLLACGGASNSPAATGRVMVGLRASALSAVSASGTLSITGPAGYSKTKTGTLPFDLDGYPTPVGSYHYTATGSGTGGATFSGSGTFVVNAGEITNLQIIMQQDNATPMAIIAPYASSFQFNLPGPGTGGWGVPLKLTALVTHPDNDRPDMDWFVYEWKHSCNGTETKPGFFVLPGEVDFFFDGHSKPTAKVTTYFTSYCQGTETITLVSENTNNLICPDKGCALISTVSFDIPYDPQGLAVDVSANFAPSVSCGLVDNAEPVPGEKVTVKATAHDPDNDALTYKWSDNCGGSFSDATLINPVWTAPATNCTTCTLLIQVTDARGGVNTGTIGLKTAPADVVQGCPVL